jgi:hypothetical protein
VEGESVGVYVVLRKGVGVGRRLGRLCLCVCWEDVVSEMVRGAIGREGV